MASFSDFLFGTADDAYSDAAKRQEEYNKQYQSSVTQALSPYQTLSDVGQTKDLQQQYISSLTGLNPSQYKTEAPTYDMSSATEAEIQAQIDPAVAYQKEEARKGLEATAAGKGGLFSSGLGKSVATSDEQLSAQARAKAQADVIAEKNRLNQIRQQQFGSGMQAGTYNLGLDTTGSQALGTAYGTMMEPLGIYSQGLMDMAGTQYGAQTGLSQQGMQIQGADTGYFGTLLGAGSQVAGSYFGGK